MLYSKWITYLMEFVLMSDNASSNGTPAAVTTAIDVSRSQDPWMLTDLTCFVGPPTNFNGGIFPTKIGLYASKIYFVNRTTDRWYFPSFANA